MGVELLYNSVKTGSQTVGDQTVGEKMTVWDQRRRSFGDKMQ